MKRYFLSLFIFLGTAGHSFAETPVEFNDKLTSITDSVFIYGDLWSIEFNNALSTGYWDNLERMRGNMEAFVKNKIAALQQMEDVNNSKPLRMALINFLKYEQKIIPQALSAFEKFNTYTKEETIIAAMDNRTILAEEETTELEKVIAAQEKYAKENGFEIEKEALEKAE